MKKWLLLLNIIMLTLSSSAKIIPWDEPLAKKTYISKAPRSQLVWTSVYLCNGCGEPFGRVDIHLRRAFAYNVCEYCTVQVKVWHRVRTSSVFQKPATYSWVWGWYSCGLWFPANEDDSYFSFDLREGEMVNHDNGYIFESEYTISPLNYCN
jgi:DNA-directed RNA polymerase subunit RPC12/RpoP